MQTNAVHRTGIRLSVVGLGTAQLRLVPERQAVETLRAGFDLGVNWVHTAADYGGAEVLVARAASPRRYRRVMVLSSASGPVEHFGWAFENTCRLLQRRGLEFFGIAGIDYCEQLGQNVWGAGGLLDFMRQQRRRGRLQGIFCTTHGSPDYVARLIASECFDAVMLSYNPLGFHLLSYYGRAEGKEYEDLPRNCAEIFPLARRHQVSLLIMKPLAGGLLCRGKAFPPRERFSTETEEVTATDVLRSILANPDVSAVVPGAASVEEARENALAGHAPLALPEDRGLVLERVLEEMRASLCSRCGLCESTCSRGLPISWLFRDGYLWSYPSELFEAQERLHYFRLHPAGPLACDSCSERTCVCPSGMDIPAALGRVHRRMLALRSEQHIHVAVEELRHSGPRRRLAAGLVGREIPERLRPRQRGVGRLWLENAGPDNWLSFATQPGSEQSLELHVRFNRRRCLRVPLQHDVGPGQRTCLTFELKAPGRCGQYPLQLDLAAVDRRGRGDETVPLYRGALQVVAAESPS